MLLEVGLGMDDDGGIRRASTATSMGHFVPVIEKGR